MSDFLKKQMSKISNIKLKIGKKSQMALVGVLTMIMLIIFFNGIKSNSKSTDSQVRVNNEINSDSSYVETLEDRLQNIISSLKGIQNAKVFIMTETSVEYVYATNEEYRLDAGHEDKSTEITFEKNGSNSIPIKKLEIYPKITGVLIVADGVDDEKKRLVVLNAVSVALNVEISKIEVLQGD